VTSEEITRACLHAIDTHDSKVGAFLLVDRDGALTQSVAVDRKRRNGEKLGRLAGLPVGLKDILCVRGMPTTCGSKMLATFVPPYDAHVVARLRDEDGVILGKTNMDEFGMGSTTENSAFMSTRNPWDLGRVPGGSSGGSAAAVAAGMVPITLGSDTGGSIRQPGSLCGVVGFKPSYGRVSRFGLVAYASSLDQVGGFARDVCGVALMLEVIAGHDPRDSTSIDQAVPPYLRNLDEPLQGLRVGIAREHFVTGLDSEVEAAVREAINVYRGLGAEITEIGLPHAPYAIATYYLIACSEASSNLARYGGVHFGHRAKDHKRIVDMYAKSRSEGFGDEVRRRIMLGTYALSAGYHEAYYVKALKARRLIHDDFLKAFESVDVIVSPVVPFPAMKIGEMVADPLAMYLADIYTVSCNLAGLPGMSIPAGMTKSGLPIGLQLLAAPLQEEKLLRAARMFEKSTDWHLRRPSL